jgi:cytochrome P450
MHLTRTTPEMLSLDEIDLYPARRYPSGEQHAAWRTLRAKAPVWRQTAPDGTPFWSVTRYPDVVDVLRDTTRFSSEHSTMLTVLEPDAAKGKAIHLIDPPRHSQVRSTTRPAMSMRVMRSQEDRIRVRIQRLVATGLAKGELDFARLVSIMPMLVAGEIMGIPKEKWVEGAKWTVAAMAAEDPSYSVGDAHRTLRTAHTFLFTMFIELIARRRAEPGGEDLISQLIRMEVDGRPATDEEIIVNCYAFVMGANPTIPQGASHLLLLLAEEPELLERLRADRSLLPGALEELLRYSSPVNHLLRRTRTEVRLGDEVIPAGGLVAAWLASANRDEDVFVDPYAFEPARRPNPQVTFGFGAHRCIGNNAAQIGLKLLLEEVVEQVREVRLAGEVRHLESNFLNGITELPLVLR